MPSRTGRSRTATTNAEAAATATELRPTTVAKVMFIAANPPTSATVMPPYTRVRLINWSTS